MEPGDATGTYGSDALRTSSTRLPGPDPTDEQLPYVLKRDCRQPNA